MTARLIWIACALLGMTAGVSLAWANVRAPARPAATIEETVRELRRQANIDRTDTDALRSEAARLDQRELPQLLRMFSENATPDPSRLQRYRALREEAADYGSLAFKLDRLAIEEGNAPRLDVTQRDIEWLKEVAIATPTSVPWRRPLPEEDQAAEDDGTESDSAGADDAEGGE